MTSLALGAVVERYLAVRVTSKSIAARTDDQSRVSFSWSDDLDVDLDLDLDLDLDETASRESSGVTAGSQTPSPKTDDHDDHDARFKLDWSCDDTGTASCIVDDDVVGVDPAAPATKRAVVDVDVDTDADADADTDADADADDVDKVVDASDDSDAVCTDPFSVFCFLDLDEADLARLRFMAGLRAVAADVDGVVDDEPSDVGLLDTDARR